MFIHRVTTPQPKPVMYDEWSGRYFEADMNDVQSAMLDANQVLISDGDLDLNTVYDRLGLPPIPMGSMFGWSTEFVTTIDVVFGSHIMPNGWPALTMSFRRDPRSEKHR